MWLHSAYGSAVSAVLSGFDRLVFRGTLLPLAWERGMHTFLPRTGMHLLDFKQYALRTAINSYRGRCKRRSIA